MSSTDTVAAPPRMVAAKSSDATDSSTDWGSETEFSVISIACAAPLVMTDTILLLLTAYTDEALGSFSDNSVDVVETINSGRAFVLAERNG